MTEHLTVSIVNNLSEIEKITNEVENLWSKYKLPLKIMYNINISIDELLSNIINYGFDDSSKHLISVEFELSNKVFTLKIIDDGKPFNPLEIDEPDINSSLEEREIGGLGIFIVKNLVDKIDYQRINNKNIILIVKNISEQHN